MARQSGNSRRSFLRRASGAALGIGVAFALVRPGRFARGEDLPRLSEDDPHAKGIQYVHDATRAERTAYLGHPPETQFCYNCKYIVGDSGQWHPCQQIPGALIHEDGWCALWLPPNEK